MGLLPDASKLTGQSKRVTYIVLGGADRMFDMGFESQVRKIISNVHPDRQVVLFSSTFPRNVSLAPPPLSLGILDIDGIKDGGTCQKSPAAASRDGGGRVHY